MSRKRDKLRVVYLDCRKKIAEGVGMEEILAFARESGLTKVESVGLLRDLYAFPLANAKQRIRESATWADAHEGGE